MKSELYLDGEIESDSTRNSLEEKSNNSIVFELPEGVVIQDLKTNKF